MTLKHISPSCTGTWQLHPAGKDSYYRCDGCGAACSASRCAPARERVAALLGERMDDVEARRREPTFWDGLPTPCARRWVTVLPHPDNPPCTVAGAMVPVVRVEAPGGVFYLDNRDGSGWDLVTRCRGLLLSGKRPRVFPGAHELGSGIGEVGPEGDLP